MSRKPSVRDSLRFGFKRFTGTPIEIDLKPYADVVAEARLADLCGLGDGAILERARTLRAAIAASADASAGRTSGSAPLRDGRGGMAACIALAAEACRRGLGLEPYEEQLIAASAMCSGKVAQMQTGEGKTLAAAVAAAYCAMRDGGAHVITANDYLAGRDAEWMRPIYERLGLTVASVRSADRLVERRASYGADVVYLTARELGFDYLRDGMAYRTDRLSLAVFRSAIVDEADSILIDEARVPLVIAGDDGSGGRGADVAAADRAVRSLSETVDYAVDAEGRKVSLTLEGQRKVEAALGVGGMHEPEAAPLFARVHAALHAHRLLSRDVDYVVIDGEARLVDAFTGRVADGRKWPWGIQAAVEAKEGLETGSEGRIYGSITTQHLMELYPRIAAMTATAEPAAPELSEAYGMGTVIIPPVRPSRRRDEPDEVFWSRQAKLEAVAAEISSEHGRGRPVLVGTASVLESEELAARLDEAGIPYALLNAKNDEAEAASIAAAGRRGAVTISTNMAGRGTDIRLGPDPELPGLGGLYVIGTNKHESRRIDDQLRGRAGRQGDPGLTRFFVSLEDELFARYGVRDFLPERYGSRPEREDGPIDDPVVRREINRAQAIIAGENAKIRSALRKYSMIVEYDRRYVRQLRDAALVAMEFPEPVEAALSRDGGRPVVEAARKELARRFLSRLDDAWADHLALAEDVREGIGLRRCAGEDPELEFIGTLAEAFESRMRELVDATVLDAGAMAEAGSAAAGRYEVPPRPATTWTYAVEEDAGPAFKPGALSDIGAAALGPLALPLFLIARAAGSIPRRERKGERRGRPG